MVAKTVWLWLSVGCLLTWFAEVFSLPKTSSICELGPCTCSRGKLECDCSTSGIKDVTLRPEMFDSLSLSAVKVRNCRDVHVTSETFSGLPALQQVSIDNVNKVILEERSFSYSHAVPQLMVNISHCHIPEIPSYCFRGLLRDVLLSDVRVSLVRPYAFSSLDHLEKLSFQSVHFALLEPQAFKRFSVELLSFVNTNVTTFPQNAMMDIEINQEMRFERVTVDRIETNALNIQSVRSFKIVQSKFGRLEPKSFNLFSKGDVSIHENTFDNVEKFAFIGLTVDNRYFLETGKQDLIFENNTFVNLESFSLTFNTSGFNPRLDWIMIKRECSCDSVDWWTTDLVYFCSDPSCSHPAPQINTVMFCLDPTFKRVKDFQTFVCKVTRSSLIVKVMIALGVIVVVLCAIALAWFCHTRRKSKRYINVPTALSALKPPAANKGHMLVVPEGKTYRETELHVIVEHAEPIISKEYVKERPDRNGNDE